MSCEFVYLCSPILSPTIRYGTTGVVQGLVVSRMAYPCSRGNPNALRVSRSTDWAAFVRVELGKPTPLNRNGQVSEIDTRIYVWSQVEEALDFRR